MELGWVTLAVAALGGAVGWTFSALVEQPPPIRLRCGVAVGVAALGAMFSTQIEGLAAALAYLVFTLAMVLLVAIDIRVHRLPREISYVGFGLSLGLLAIQAFIDREMEQLWNALLGAAIALALMMVVYLLSRGDIGEGDVRIGPLLGLHLGWISPRLVIVGIMMGFVMLAIVGVVGLVGGRLKLRSALPFGPFLAAGSATTILVGQSILERWS